MLTYVERGYAFTNDFGYIDEPLYGALTNMLGAVCSGTASSPATQEMYTQFRSCLLAMSRTSDIGWGYGILFRRPLINWKQLWENDKESRNNDELIHN